MLKSVHVLMAIMWLALPLSARADPPANATVTPGVPDLPAPDGCACADSALANVIKYFSEHQFPKLGQDSAGKKLSDEELVKAVNKNQPGRDVPRAASEYIKSKDKDYADALLVHDLRTKSFTSIVTELSNGQLVLLNLQQGQNFSSLHTVTVVGWSDEGGVQQIGIHDINAPNRATSTDYTGSLKDGTDFYTVHADGVGSGFHFQYDGRNFSSVTIVAVSPKKPESDGKPSSKPGDSAGKSVHYSALTKALSFSNDFITATGFAGDPLIGAEVSPPPLDLISTDSATRGALFRPTGDAPFMLHFGDQVVLQANLGQMRYDGANNTLVADLLDVSLAGAAAGSPFFDAGLAPFDSPWLEHIGAILDPASPEFQDDNVLHITYHPLGNLWDLTDGFKAPAEEEISNVLKTQFVVSEPPLAGLLGSGIVLLCLGRRRRVAGIGKRIAALQRRSQARAR